MKRHLSTPIRHAGAIQVNLAVLAFFAITAFLLLTEHRAHVFGPLLFLLLLACLPLQFFHASRAWRKGRAPGSA